MLREVHPYTPLYMQAYEIIGLECILIDLKLILLYFPLDKTSRRTNRCLYALAFSTRQ